MKTLHHWIIINSLSSSVINKNYCYVVKIMLYCPLMSEFRGQGEFKSTFLPLDLHQLNFNMWWKSIQDKIRAILSFETYYIYQIVYWNGLHNCWCGWECFFIVAISRIKCLNTLSTRLFSSFIFVPKLDRTDIQIKMVAFLT